MKKLSLALVAVVALVATISTANRDLDIYSLENLQALDAVDHLPRTKSTITWLNERALGFLPVAATLRAEDALVGVALGVSR